MQLSRIFRAVRKMMERNEGSRLICSCISNSSIEAPAMYKYLAIAEVRKRIYPRYTVEAWAWRHNLPDASKATPQDFREFHIRWLKALEEEFKAKGD